MLHYMYYLVLNVTYMNDVLNCWLSKLQKVLHININNVLSCSKEYTVQINGGECKFSHQYVEFLGGNRFKTNKTYEDQNWSHWESVGVAKKFNRIKNSSRVVKILWKIYSDTSIEASTWYKIDNDDRSLTTLVHIWEK